MNYIFGKLVHPAFKWTFICVRVIHTTQYITWFLHVVEHQIYPKIAFVNISSVFLNRFQNDFDFWKACLFSFKMNAHLCSYHNYNTRYNMISSCNLHDSLYKFSPLSTFFLLRSRRNQWPRKDNPFCSALHEDTNQRVVCTCRIFNCVSIHTTFDRLYSLCEQQF